MNDFKKNDKNVVRRHPERGAYDEQTIFEILDGNFICHVGFIVDNQPFVIPTIYGREGDKIYFHGAPASRMLGSLKSGIPVCVTVTMVDGLVLARSVFHHSMNYRSVVLFGTAAELPDAEKNHALHVVSEQILKGRWDEARQPSEKEIKATSVLCMKIDEASAKIRTGPPKDAAEDYELPVWAGIVPMQVSYGAAEADPLLRNEISLPESVKALSPNRD